MQPPTTQDTPIAAECLRQAWQSRSTLSAWPPAVEPRDRAWAYPVQNAFFSAAQGQHLGWKIAATSLAGQQHIGVTAPLAGRLMRERCHADGAAVDIQRNRMRVAEAEFAFRMGRDVRFADFARMGEASLIADFACACDVVMGPQAQVDVQRWDFAGHAVSVAIDGLTVAQGQGANVLGDPRWALAWLAQELCDHGDHLRAGDWVITGTCVTPVPIAPGQTVRCDFGVLGAVGVQLI
ncbi:MAG: hydratase [Betaproteobacteria bacterium]|nr:hydratase [Betaproteobacteria bacterium]